jgi:hypothetical protein
MSLAHECAFRACVHKASGSLCLPLIISFDQFQIIGSVRALTYAFSDQLKILENHTQAGDKVKFLASDVFLPSPAVLTAIVEGETELEGKILSFSDSGQNPRFFAVVEVLRTHSLVVPVERVQVVKPSDPQDQT